MENLYKKKSMFDLLQERYPEIAFALTLNPFTPRQLEFQQQLLLPLDEVEVLYVFGLGHYFESLKSWLQQRKGRVLIVLEDDLGVIAAFLNHPSAKSLLECPNIYLKYVENWEVTLEELPALYPTDKVQVAAAKKYKKERAAFFKKIQLQLYRNSASFGALLSEALFAHKLFANLYPNLFHIPHSFFANRFKGAFKNIPAIICGAGPSLESAIEELKKMEHEALLIAGGSAITAFSCHQIMPHFCMALDPNFEEYKKLKESSFFEVPFLYAPRLQKDLLGTCNGPFGYMRSDTGGLAEAWFEKKIGLEGEAIGPELGREAFSVTTLAASFAYEMGCHPIIFAGVDLAFTQKRRYAQGIVEEKENRIQHDARITEQIVVRKDRHGKKVDSLVKWVMESDALSAFAKNHPDTQFINATEGGIGFSHIPYMTLQEVRKKYCQTFYDLKGQIHTQVQKINFPKEISRHLETASDELKASLKRALIIVQELKKSSKETGKMVLLQMDLEEEVAFDCFLQPVESALEKLFARYFFESPLEKKLAKWSHMEATLQSYLQTLHTQSAYCEECAN